MALTAKKQAVWDTLKGLQDETLKDYAAGNPEKMSKYMRIQKALNQPQASFQPVKAKRVGPGGSFKKWQDALEELVKFMPLRRKAINNAMRDIEAKIGEKVKWGKMSYMFKITYTRYRNDVVLGADVLLEGRAKKAGSVNYYYDNSVSAEGAHRYVIIEGKKQTI